MHDQEEQLVKQLLMAAGYVSSRNWEIWHFQSTVARKYAHAETKQDWKIIKDMLLNNDFEYRNQKHKAITHSFKITTGLLNLYTYLNKPQQKE